MTSVTLDSIPVNGANAHGDDGRVEVEGWWGAPEVRQSLHDRQGSKGQWISQSQDSGRAVSLRGWHMPGTGRTGKHVAAWLESLTAPLVDTDGVLRVLDHDGAYRRAVVRRAGAVMMDPRPNRLQWSVPLIAIDPIKYGDTEKNETGTILGGTTTIDITVENEGGTRVLPHLIEVTHSDSTTSGVITISRVGAPHQVATSQGIVAADGLLELFPHTEEAHLDGTRDMSLLDFSTSDSPWFDLRPQSETVRVTRTGNSGQTAVTVYWRDGWL